MPPLAKRLEAATMGFGITLAPLCIIAASQLAFLPQIIGIVEGADGNEQALLMSSLRKDWLILHISAAIMVAIYWLLTAMLGKGQFLRLRVANIILAFFVFAIMALTLYGSFIQWPAKLKGLCPFLDIPDTHTQIYAFDGQSRCDMFVQRTHMMMIFGLLGLSTLLLVTSLMVRIISSRRANSARS